MVQLGSGFETAHHPRTRRLHHTAAARFDVVVDTHGAPLADITVAMGSGTIRIAFEDERYRERTLSPPNEELAFGEDRTATYRNGVLTVSVGLVERD